MAVEGMPWLRDMLNQASQSGARSTALMPIGWMTAILSSSSIASGVLRGPSWLTIIFGVGAALSIGLYLFAYLYLLFKDRDALRSEKYSIQRLAIEKGLFGDSTSGVIDVDVVPAQRALPAASAQDSEDNDGA